MNRYGAYPRKVKIKLIGIHMPEGPEVKIEADKIANALVGVSMEAVYFEQTRLKRFGKILTDTKVLSVEARGKAMVIRFDNERYLYSHNQLYGRWYVRPRGEFPATNRTLRVALHGAEHSGLLYSASEIAVLSEPALNEHPYIKKLGPNPLDDALSWQDFVARIKAKRFQNRSLGALYLDQAFIAGIGNYLRSEILFRAGLDPERSPKSLSTTEISRLARATVTLTRRAYLTKGITNPAGRVRELKKQGHKRGGYRFAVFDRAAEPCYECGQTITRLSLNGRRLYFCNVCQK
ncbi:MAG: endonuclease VIII [Pseudomonadota bacterium]